MFVKKTSRNYFIEVGNITLDAGYLRTLELEGEISYGESQRAWNLIRLKKDILKEFPQLKQKREKFGYKLVMHRSFKELKKAIEKMDKEDNTIPIFLFLCQK